MSSHRPSLLLPSQLARQCDCSENLAGSRIIEADSQYGTEAHLPHSRRRAVQEINIAVYCILGIN